QLADLAFSGPASGDGAAGAELATRVLLAILALAVLTVPGTWADVLVGFVLVLTISAVWVDYGERRSALKKSPSVPVMPRTLGDDDLRVLLPKTRTVAPATELAKGADATLAAVVEERDPQGRIATVARTYDIILPLAVPASKLTDDVPVDVSTAAGIDIKQFL